MICIMNRLEKGKMLEKYIMLCHVDEGFGYVKNLYEKTRKDDIGITLDS